MSTFGNFGGYRTAAGIESLGGRSRTPLYGYLSGLVAVVTQVALAAPLFELFEGPKKGVVQCARSQPPPHTRLTPAPTAWQTKIAIRVVES